MAEDYYEVERIVKHKIKNGVIKYFIKWKGYGSEDNTWEPEESLIACREILDNYKKLVREKEKKKKQQDKKSLPIKLKQEELGENTNKTN